MLFRVLKLSVVIFVVVMLLAGCPGLADSKSNNADLASLTLSTGTLSPAFDSAITSYIVNVDNDVDSITITGTPADSSATVSSNSGVAQSLDFGSNEITITVTAEDGTTKDYIIVVQREPNNPTSTSYAVVISPIGANPGELVNANVLEMAEGALVTLTAALNSSRQVALSTPDLTITPSMINTNGGTATFTMPAHTVEITAVFDNFSVILANGNSFDFFTREIGDHIGGDLYYLSASGFWCNNVPQRGVKSLGDIGATPFDQVAIPIDGYSHQGVPAVIGHTYVALGHEPYDSEFAIFRIINIDDSGNVTIEFATVDSI